MRHRRPAARDGNVNKCCSGHNTVSRTCERIAAAKRVPKAAHQGVTEIDVQQRVVVHEHEPAGCAAWVPREPQVPEPCVLERR